MSNPYLKAAAKAIKVYDKKTNEEFNPKDFGPADKSGRRQVSASNTVFNAKGELNASSKAEAFDKISGILNGVSNGTYQTTTTASAPDMQDEDAFNLIRQAFADPQSEGFRMLGQGLLNPIKEIIDYEGLARKVWAPRTVKAGEVIRYDKDPFVVAFQIAEDGQTPQSVVEGRYIYPSEFEVTCFESIEIKDQFRAQFDILARMQDRARQAVEKAEDTAMVNILQAGGNQANPTTFFPSLNLAALESMRYQIERHRLVCDKFIINRQEVSDLVNVLSMQVDPVTLRELIMGGYIGTVLNADIITTAGVNSFEILDPGSVIAVTKPEYLGGMPIRVELMSEPISEAVNGLPRKGWFFYELLSMVLINPAGVALGRKL
jgi:hypothetical protein